ncbi:hypothetical protein K439DRAFT_1643292 [Ramaria rubella]|nr:hypothetical protein K439DRAFT_1643290 [Ramaria rubella]KAF8573033.1 hypothetical protein K439DRAFT_1643292 [Ramaria rubella]
MFAPVPAALPVPELTTDNVQDDPLIQLALIKHEIVFSVRSRATIAHSPELTLTYARLLKAKMPD